MGRFRKPKEAHALAGYPGHRSKAERNRPELELVRNVGKCPDHIKGVAASEWDRLAPELSKKGMLTITDRASLEAYCISYGRWREAENLLKRSGGLLKGKRINPAFNVVQRCVDQMQGLAAKLGRMRALQVVDDSGKGDADDDFFSDGKADA